MSYDCRWMGLGRGVGDLGLRGGSVGLSQEQEVKMVAELEHEREWLCSSLGLYY